MTARYWISGILGLTLGTPWMMMCVAYGDPTLEGAVGAGQIAAMVFSTVFFCAGLYYTTLAIRRQMRGV